MIDTHAHLNDDRLYDNINEIITSANEVGVSDIVCVAYDLLSSVKACEIANDHEHVYATIGIHPHDAKTFSKEIKEELIILAKNKKVVAFGEIGLDFYYNLSSQKTQKKVFTEQLELANFLSLPVVIHTRDAISETLQILTENKHLLKNGGIMHCFSGNLGFAKQVIDLGLVLGVGGTITFKNSQELQNVVKNITLEKIVLETDCPYLTPVPFRGVSLNEPKFIPIIANHIAKLLNTTTDKIDEITTKNARKVYKI